MTHFSVQKPRKEFLKDTEISTLGNNLWISRKYRGFTGVAHVSGGKAQIKSGNNVTTFELPHLEFKHDGIYVGEIYTPEVEDENNLQDTLNTGNYDKIKFAVYDVLGFNGQDLTKAQLSVRKEFLSANTNSHIHAVEETQKRTKDELLSEILLKGWEGVVAADLRGLHTLNTNANRKRQRGLSWKLKPSMHIDLCVTQKNGNIISAINPANPNGQIYKLGSFRDSLDVEKIKVGDIVEVQFCSIDREGNLVHPVVTTIKF